MTDSSLWHGSIGGHEGRQADSGLVRRGHEGMTWELVQRRNTEREPFFYLFFSSS